MIKRFLNWLYKTIIHQISYYTHISCYSKREYSGDAAMGCCSGLVNGDDVIESERHPCPCADCPYYVDVLQISAKINKDASELVTKTLKGELP